MEDTNGAGMLGFLPFTHWKHKLTSDTLRCTSYHKIEAGVIFLIYYVGKKGRMTCPTVYLQ